jgi:hypothetical protein
LTAPNGCGIRAFWLEASGNSPESLFHAEAKNVQEGMKIGFVTDYFGKLILEARAPVSGIILHINAVPSLKKGDNTADIATIVAHAP